MNHRMRWWLAGLAAVTALGIVLLAVFRAHSPNALDIGAAVRVVNVGEQELNIRSRPGIDDSSILFRAAAGTMFQVIGGPRPADDFVWWQIQDPLLKLKGWAAENYLQRQQAETGAAP